MIGGQGGAAVEKILWSNTGPNVKVAKLQIFNIKVEKALGFLTAYRFHIRMKMRNATVEKQVQ